MKWMHLLLLTACICGIRLPAQHVFHGLARDSLTGETLVGVTALVEQTAQGAASDINGRIEIRDIPAGRQIIRFTFVGYAGSERSFVFPMDNPDSVILILLAPAENELEEVTISATRTNSRIEAMPTRIEVIGTGDLSEENGIKPSGISSMLSDIAGVQLQQTSATTANTLVRMQGLDGKYTQMLYDGMPLFGGFSGSLGVLNIPPLDLKQIEIIKGASSTLHGNGAVAGLVNLVPKAPQSGKPEGSITLNQTSLLETDGNAFFSNRNRKAGYTFFGGGMFQQYRDINSDGFTDVPLLYNLYLHPSLFLYLRNQGLVKISLNTNYLSQEGGDMEVMKHRSDSLHQFRVSNLSVRNTLAVSYSPSPGNQGLTARASVSQFYRKTETNLFMMEANQFSLFSELSYLKLFPADKLVAGINLNGDFFQLIQGDSIHFGNSTEMTPGMFIHNEWTASRIFTLEAGLRADYNTLYGWFLLPRLSALFNITKGIKTRVGGGMGYGTPTNFLSAFEEQEYPYIMPLPSGIRAERSTGANWDINYDKVFSEKFNMTLNQSFFYTYIDRPVINTTLPGGDIVFSNATRPVTTVGFETYLRMMFFEKFEAYLGYVFTDARRSYDTVNTMMSLNARNKVSTVITWEPGRHWMTGIESSYIGEQITDDHASHPGYFFLAAMVSYQLNNWRFVLNGENLLDYRQSKKEPIVLPPYTNPVFPQLWAPIDGRVINLSVTLKLGNQEK